MHKIRLQKKQNKIENNPQQKKKLGLTADRDLGKLFPDEWVIKNKKTEGR